MKSLTVASIAVALAALSAVAVPSISLAANAEFYIYGDYKGEIAKDVACDGGLLTYQHPRNGLKPSANTLEVHGAITAGPITAKYSQSTTNLFDAKMAL
ncbi:MAG: TorF family putative porin [Betaproteobacteria bacterium]